MTSMEFFKKADKGFYQPPEWGTGKQKAPVDVGLPRNPSWRYTGEPVSQYYGLTKLKLSNIRSNDELVPKPQAIQIGKDFIHRPFPAEHPHSSHITKFAVFPKFDSTEDPKRGSVARGELPISSEMPANPYDVIVKEKTKGFPYRHEFQDFPPEGEKAPLYWPGEDFFDQRVKTLGDRQQFYPIPPKTMVPNLPVREGDMKVAPRTANALRNVEREQWRTSQNIDFTGLGPANPVILDNLAEKTNKLIMTGREDDTLYQHFQTTFDPPRGMEGRLPRKVTALPLHQKSIVSGTTSNRDYRPKLTLTEKEERRLLHGTEYLNLPDTTSDPNRDVRWRDLDSATRAGPRLEKLEEAKALVEEVDAPYPQAGTPPPPSPSYMAGLKTERDLNVQEIEAQNRWKVLELQTPAHDQAAINHKMDLLHDKDKPPTFYGHEGRYNEERSGLYKTSYDPHVLTGSMNAESGAPSEVLNTLHSNRQAHHSVSLPAARLNEDVNAALKWSRTFNLARPELSGDIREGADVIHTYNNVKAGQRGILQAPGPHQARPLVQENELLQREATTMGDSYNAKKFLQEAALDRHARGEPLTLMSHENQSLNRVRSRAVPRVGKSVQFNGSVTVATMSPTSTPPVDVSTQPLQGGGGVDQFPTRALPAALHLSQEVRAKLAPTQYTSTHALYRKENDGLETSDRALRHSAPALFDTSSRGRTVHFDGDNSNNSACRDIVPTSGVDFYRTFPSRPGSSHGHGCLDSEYTDQFRSASTNFMPSDLKMSWAATSYQNQFPTSFDLSYKKDARFDWTPGCGVPRPQTSLIDQQDAFYKTEVRRKFHEDFPETNPQLRFNIVTGKRHHFGGFNAQVIHG